VHWLAYSVGVNMLFEAVAGAPVFSVVCNWPACFSCQCHVFSQLLHQLGRNEYEMIAQGVKYRSRKKQHCLRFGQKCMQRVVLLGAVPFEVSGIHGVKPLLSSNKPWQFYEQQVVQIL